ncbi:YsnF/AvaK domain-containing protein [Tsukamurella soli]|uniref:YsnF/AvaK domain-containing protein n=1 Tax=Tsukamurella soli TaxID=644556 RepID=UPI003609176C
MKDAPHLDVEGGISAQQERELLAHYGVGGNTAEWAQYGQHVGTDAAAAATSSQSADPTDRHAAEQTPHTGADEQNRLVRSEERLDVDTTCAEAGRARLRKFVVTEEQTITVPVTREEVSVVREPIDDPSVVGQSRIGDDATEVTLHEDQVRVTKKTVPVERVGLEVHDVQDEQTVSDQVRKERIEAEGVGPQTTNRSGNGRG